MLTEPEGAAGLAFTENGALAHRSTGAHCLDFFSTCGALRSAEPEVLCRLFADAYLEDGDLAMKALFYARDIRGGLGERRVFQTVLRWLAHNGPRSVIRNLALIGEYGRWDDLLTLLDTPCEPEVLLLIKDRLSADFKAMEQGEPVSLLGKWLPSINTSSPSRRRQARLLARGLGMSEREYRLGLSRLRAHIDILERRLCAKDYSFDYSAQPSNAMHKYRKAFLRHDKRRYTDFLDRVRRGEARLNAGTLYPYEIVRACLSGPDYSDLWDMDSASLHGSLSPEMVQALDASWKSLPDYSDSRNALVVIDGSASMYFSCAPRPADVAISLGIYFAERNTGYFKDHFITFSAHPQLVALKGDDIVERARYCASFNGCENTDLRATFELLLNTALENHLPQEALPETLYIISDMEFDCGTEPDATLFEEIKQLYACNGYRLPRLVYWNVESRHEQYPVKKDEHGTVLVSGASPSLFKMVIDQDISPEQFMLQVLNSERYRPVRA